MATISQMLFLDAFSFMNEKFCILIKISLKLVPKGPVDKNAAPIGTKPLSEPMLTWFTHVYMWH